VIVLLPQHVFFLIKESLKCLDCLVSSIGHLLDVFLLLDADTSFILAHLVFENVVLA